MDFAVLWKRVAFTRWPGCQSVNAFLRAWVHDWRRASNSVAEALPLLIIIGSSVGGGCVFIVCVITLASICCRHAAKGEVMSKDLCPILKRKKKKPTNKNPHLFWKKNQYKLNSFCMIADSLQVIGACHKMSPSDVGSMWKQHTLVLKLSKLTQMKILSSQRPSNLFFFSIIETKLISKSIDHSPHCPSI